ncbi:hypothetical protein C5F48_22180 [Cereibacter changlensis JA139]|uniref:Uncharacterized protein n=1 Tax=Cereibacter changlensis JA139 TaxID=1188249 RepID=A0A2T4JNT6_9RHOB|nr:hypothetical protein [Cereibacter changlensis]PTE19570.1 hypothetical protein C5F48_22180 [Cereibacter changlensis JA139]
MARKTPRSAVRTHKIYGKWTASDGAKRGKHIGFRAITDADMSIEILFDIEFPLRQATIIAVPFPEVTSAEEPTDAE